VNQRIKAALLAPFAALGIGALAGCGGGAEPQAELEARDLAAQIHALEEAVAAARKEVRRLRDIEEIENVAGSYGFYVDKSMQDDIADLFTSNGVVEILGRGVFLGQDRVREYMHNLGPVGPREGALFNHMHLQPVIDVSEDGNSADVRSRLFVMFGILDTNAQWGAGVYENHLVKQDGVWKIDYLHAYQTFYTNYEDGWAKRASGIFAPYDRLPPDLPQSVPYDPYPAAFVPPFHYVNPVSGRDDYYKSAEWTGPRALPQ
jgi:outer membrane murein-binding lipoprotein Lpp